MSLLKSSIFNTSLAAVFTELAKKEKGEVLTSPPTEQEKLCCCPHTWSGEKRGGEKGQTNHVFIFSLLCPNGLELEVFEDLSEILLHPGELCRWRDTHNVMSGREGKWTTLHPQLDLSAIPLKAVLISLRLEFEVCRCDRCLVPAATLYNPLPYTTPCAVFNCFVPTYFSCYKIWNHMPSGAASYAILVHSRTQIYYHAEVYPW